MLPTMNLSARIHLSRVPSFWSMLHPSVSGTNLTWVYVTFMNIRRILTCHIGKVRSTRIEEEHQVTATRSWDRREKIVEPRSAQTWWEEERYDLPLIILMWTYFCRFCQRLRLTLSLSLNSVLVVCTLPSPADRGNLAALMAIFLRAKSWR
jgi:hypothetical protein